MTGETIALLVSPPTSSAFSPHSDRACVPDTCQGFNSNCGFSARNSHVSLIRKSVISFNGVPELNYFTRVRKSSRWLLEAAEMKNSETVNALQEEEWERESDALRANVESVGHNSRRVSARIRIDTPLEAVWAVLTDYSNLAEYIPSLAVNEILERRPNGALLLQIGQQNLGLGIKFKAKAVVEVEEEPLREKPEGRQRVIIFNMVEGDFKRFQGAWQMQQGNLEGSGQENMAQTILSYSVEVTPQGWLPVAVVEGIISKEICTNLFCVRKQAEYIHKSKGGSNISRQE